MPRNIGIGGKSKKRGKKFGEVTRELDFKEEGQEYGQAIRLLGDCRLEILCSDGEKRAGHIKGSLRRRIFINMGDIVLVSLRDFEKEKCDIILKYTEDEVRKLKKAGEIPETFKLPDEEKKEDDDDLITFEKKEKDDDDDKIQVKKKSYNDELEDLDDDEEEDEEDEDYEMNKPKNRKESKNSQESEEKKSEVEEEDEEEEEEEEEEKPVYNNKKKVNNINVNTGKFSSKKENKPKRGQSDRRKEIDDL
jgi:translation initiation factor 1A